VILRHRKACRVAATVDPGRGHHRAHLLRAALVPMRTAPPPRRRRNPQETEPKKKEIERKIQTKVSHTSAGDELAATFQIESKRFEPPIPSPPPPLERGPLAANLGPISLLGFGWLRIAGASDWDRPRVGSAVSDRAAPPPPRLLMVGGGGREGDDGGCGGRG
jgi:hypothetical protein